MNGRRCRRESTHATRLLSSTPLKDYTRSGLLSSDEQWLDVLLRCWTSLAPEVRTQFQLYMRLSPRDHKNRHRLERKLKVALSRSETFRHDAA